MVYTVRSESEIDRILASYPGLIVIDAFATWCGPCKVLAPKLEEMEREFSTVRFIKVDVDEISNFADKNDISAMPTLLFMKKGIELARMVGIHEQNIRNMIQKHM